MQRVNLTTALGSSLVNTLYILDEPSIGLHPRDSRRLVRILHHLKENQNTIVVVEHFLEIIRESDRILDLGPGAGEHGGEVVYFGTPAGHPPGRAFAHRAVPRRQAHDPCASASPTGATGLRYHAVRGPSQNNLKDIDVTMPLGLLVRHRVSGSGKSTLVHEVLYNGFKRPAAEPSVRQGVPCHRGRRPDRRGRGHGRSVPHWAHAARQSCDLRQSLRHIRRLFAATPEAQARGFGASTFSFNTPGGRCETCQGSGFEKVEMQFLSDIFVACPECEGARFRHEVLEDAVSRLHHHGRPDRRRSPRRCVFSRYPGDSTRVASRCRRWRLDYIRLGQPLNTLSGGESQRLKLASHLSVSQGGRRVFIFDGADTGLHFEGYSHAHARLARLFRAGAFPARDRAQYGSH